MKTGDQKIMSAVSILSISLCFNLLPVDEQVVTG